MVVSGWVGGGCGGPCSYIYIYIYTHVFIYIYIYTCIHIIRTCKRMMWGQVWRDLGDKKCIFNQQTVKDVKHWTARTSTVPGSRWEGFPLGSGHRESGPGKHLCNDFDGRIIYTVYTNRLKWL